MEATETVQLEVWFDFACPWCYLGRRFASVALQDLDERERPDVHWRAFQLDPTIPAEGMDNAEYFARKFPDPSVIEEAQQRLVLLGEDAGIEYRFDRQRIRANSLLAHRVVAAGYREELDYDQISALVDAIFAANFTNGIDIGSAELIKEVVADALLDEALAAKLVDAASSDAEIADRVANEISEAQQLGISGVPAFVANRRVMVPGAVPPNAILALLERATSEIAE